MTDKEKVIKLVEEKLTERMFLVDLTISRTNKITVVIDSFDGITIHNCVDISRNVEHNLDREQEDFELEVTSAGLTENFKVLKQYYKNIGREIEVSTINELNLKGLLKNADEEGIILETTSKEIPEGMKKKQIVVRENFLKYNEIKSAKAVISF